VPLKKAKLVLFLMDLGMCWMKYIVLVASVFMTACNWNSKNRGKVGAMTVSDTLLAKAGSQKLDPDSLAVDSFKADQTKNNDTIALAPSTEINTKNVNPNELVNFAQTLIGTPYVYASTNPKVGFDCSGFITYVFNHFGISVPRSSIDFTEVGKEVLVPNAKRGDLILFTGTNPDERLVGHMGIVISNTDTLRFIHSSSGKAMGVTITPLNQNYLRRFVKVIRVFPQNN
jgi:cell wall-associated NlpC family hydrolase